MTQGQLVVTGMVRYGIDDPRIFAVDYPVSSFAREPIICGLIWARLDELGKRKGWGMRMLV